jgi:hypothetical protein
LRDVFGGFSRTKAVVGVVVDLLRIPAIEERECLGVALPGLRDKQGVVVAGIRWRRNIRGKAVSQKTHFRLLPITDGERVQMYKRLLWGIVT